MLLTIFETLQQSFYKQEFPEDFRAKRSNLGGVGGTYFLFIVDESCSLRAQIFDQTEKHCFSSLCTLQTEENMPRANTLLILRLPITHRYIPGMSPCTQGQEATVNLNYSSTVSTRSGDISSHRELCADRLYASTAEICIKHDVRCYKTVWRASSACHLALNPQILLIPWKSR